MTGGAIWLWLAGLAMAATAVAHSLLGERLLIGPQLAARANVMASPLARQVTRFAWHLTTVLMCLCAALVVWPGTPRPLIVLAGVAWLVSGALDAVITRGRHVGWPMLAAAGMFALIGALA